MTAVVEQLAQSLTRAHTLEELTRPLLQLLQAVTGLESTYLTTIDLQAGQQHVLYARNTQQRALEIPEGLTVPWHDTLCKRALEEGRMSTSDVGACWPDSDAARQLGIQTYVSTPIRTDDGLLLGTLCGASARRQDIAPQAEEIMRLFSSVIANFLEREQLVAELRTANTKLMAYALTDPLTGLPNRRALYEELERLRGRALREGGSVLVGVVDLDGFKGINDRLGHKAGDQALIACAEILTRNLRESDAVGRLGGDEFAVLLLGTDLEGGKQKAASLAETLKGEGFSWQGASSPIEGSFGVRAFSGQPDPEDWLAEADAAMWVRKKGR